MRTSKAAARRQNAIALIATLGGFLFGYVSGVFLASDQARMVSGTSFAATAGDSARFTA